MNAASDLYSVGVILYEMLTARAPFQGDSAVAIALKHVSQPPVPVRRLRPEVVICPDPTAVFFGDRYYNHHDHRITGWATLDAAAPMAGSPHYFPGFGGVHAVPRVLMSGTLEPNVWVDVTATLETKVDALFCHRSQLPTTDEWFRDFLRDRAEESGRVAGVRYAEGFRRLWLAE